MPTLPGQLTDPPIVLLVIGLVVLLASMALMSVSLPVIRWRWLRRRRVSRSAVPRRRIVTGRPAALRSHADAGRQTTRPSDDPQPMIDVHRAEELIVHYLDTDPSTLAQVISAWLDADAQRTERIRR